MIIDLINEIPKDKILRVSLKNGHVYRGIIKRYNTSHISLKEDNSYNVMMIEEICSISYDE